MSVCWDNVIVRRVFGLLGSYYLEDCSECLLYLVGFLNHSSLESLLCFDFFKYLECLVGFLFVLVGVFITYTQ